MRLRIPESLHRHMKSTTSTPDHWRGATILHFYGPYGTIELVAVPDEDFCEVEERLIVKKIYKYKDEA